MEYCSGKTLKEYLEDSKRVITGRNSFLLFK